MEKNKDIISNEIDTPTIASACPTDCTSEISRIVNFCCLMEIPSNLGITAELSSAPTALFNTDCLTCVIDPCTITSTICSCQITNTVYRIRIVGNIPFLINKPIDSNKCKPANAKLNLCCNKSVCVNNIVCTKCNEADAEAACADIKRKLAICSNTTVTFNTTTQDSCANSAASFLKISGYFTLPSCLA